MGDEKDSTIEGEEMSAPSVARPAVSEPGPDGFGDRVTLPMPPQDGFVAEDLDRIPDLPPHAELIDGNLVLVSPQKLFHMVMLKLLEREMDAQALDGLRVVREFSLRLGEKQRPEPDLMLVEAEALRTLDQTWFPPEAVKLVVEVVSPESKIRDRERKPQLYARAGIPHFWLVEKEGEGAVVYEYEKDPASPSGDYGRATVHRGTLKTSVPVATELDLTDLMRR